MYPKRYVALSTGQAVTTLPSTPLCPVSEPPPPQCVHLCPILLGLPQTPSKVPCHLGGAKSKSLLLHFAMLPSQSEAAWGFKARRTACPCPGRINMHVC